MKRLVVLDFDGTIYRGDSMRDFAKHLSVMKYALSMAIILIPYLFSLIGVIHRNFLKKVFLYINFKGKTKSELQKQAKEFSRINKEQLYPLFWEYYTENNSSEVDFVILTGSCEEWVAPFCQKIEAQLICTELKYGPNETCEGVWKKTNLVGEEKVKLLQRTLDLNSYDQITSFGDSNSDKHLAKISTEFHLNFFKGK